MKRSLKSKRNINNVLRSKLFLIFCLTLVVLLSVSVVKEMLRKNEINQEIKVLETEIVSLEDNNQELTNLIDYLNSSSWQEKEVKTRLNLKEAGEEVVFIPQENKNMAYNNILSTEQESTKLARLNNTEKWWNYFFNN